MHDLAFPSSGCASGARDACLFGLSLCSGAGGLDLGLAIAIPGYRAVGHVERETFAAATLVARMEDASLDRAPVWDDVATFDGRPWRGAVARTCSGLECFRSTTHIEDDPIKGQRDRRPLRRLVPSPSLQRECARRITRSDHQREQGDGVALTLDGGPSVSQATPLHTHFRHDLVGSFHVALRRFNLLMVWFAKPP